MTEAERRAAATEAAKAKFHLVWHLGHPKAKVCGYVGPRAAGDRCPA